MLSAVHGDPDVVEEWSRCCAQQMRSAGDTLCASACLALALADRDRPQGPLRSTPHARLMLPGATSLPLPEQGIGQWVRRPYPLPSAPWASAPYQPPLVPARPAPQAASTPPSPGLLPVRPDDGAQGKTYLGRELASVLARRLTRGFLGVERGHDCRHGRRQLGRGVR